MPAPSVRRRIRVSGIVQGVGFRPFVYGLATGMNLAGFVGNDTAGVFIEIESGAATLDVFVTALEASAPAAARIQRIESENIQPTGDTSFRIVASHHAETGTALVAPDLRTCDDCLRELHDPDDRRYGYPFINCTNCGPRFTITERTPYDRPNTTMRPFEMCDACSAEYGNPTDRRFHAQPNACPECGPTVRAVPPAGDPIADARRRITAGEVVAIKGLGGFHLACDATSDTAVALLRERKGRVDKPFAVMVADLETARSVAVIDAAEVRLLTSRERPIILLAKREDTAVSDLVAPGNGYLGVMLPYTPLHDLLVEPGEVWVMTSGNLSEEPIVTKNDEALERLGTLSDSYLIHDRTIYVPCDDSVIRVLDGAEYPIRRSRGYAPFPVPLPFNVPPLLATGGELKATFCLAAGHDGFMSQHIGDMENLETLDAFTGAVGHFVDLFRIEPELIAADLHPGYLSAKWAERRGLPVVKVQHHHAHIASVMAEHGRLGPVIGFSFDGTGYGTDGAVWGGEILVSDYEGFERVGHLKATPLPGGDAAVKHPARMALSYLRTAGISWSEDLPPVVALPDTERALLETQLDRGINTIPTTSMGRLFDAVSAIAGVRQSITYEAQAAIELEALIDASEGGTYSFTVAEWDESLVIDPTAVLRSVADDIAAGESAGTIAARFHRGVAGMIVETAERVRRRTGLTTVGLSGGVFQNVTLTHATRAALVEKDFEVLLHRLVPPNDGGLALGQAVIAAARR
ncbi:MAG: carbamoyltransferase HypF [Actinomycetota bacterium]|nr:carbamoyltransferase HypF [Actinomycetota bacterium]